jgi:fluoride ion exporter CrcB/FEX
MTLLLVAVGAAVGAPLRYLTDLFIRADTTRSSRGAHSPLTLPAH